MKFIAVTTGYSKRPTSAAGFSGKPSKSAEEYADALIQLFEKCRGVVAKPVYEGTSAAKQLAAARFSHPSLQFSRRLSLRPSSPQLSSRGLFCRGLFNRGFAGACLPEAFFAATFLTGAFLAGTFFDAGFGAGAFFAGAFLAGVCFAAAFFAAGGEDLRADLAELCAGAQVRARGFRRRSRSISAGNWTLCPFFAAPEAGRAALLPPTLPLHRHPRPLRNCRALSQLVVALVAVVAKIFHHLQSSGRVSSRRTNQPPVFGHGLH